MLVECAGVRACADHADRWALCELHGGEHMRSMVRFPEGKQMYPELMRGAGYYCTNNAKEDYNLTQTKGALWDESSKKAHWRNRPAGKPFLAVFNSEKSHESKIRVRPHVQVHDPAKVDVPAYHPDTPEVRQDWAQYYDAVSEADADAGVRLRELQEAGLAEDTVVFYYADHGSGMPGNKRWPYNRGLQVPLAVYVPEVQGTAARGLSCRRDVGSARELCGFCTDAAESGGGAGAGMDAGAGVLGCACVRRAVLSLWLPGADG